MITRRKLLLVLGASMLAAPLGSHAQQQRKVWRVGFLSPRHVDFDDTDYYYGPFRQGMRELGYVEGKNLIIEWRSSEGNDERLPALAAELVKLKVNVIVTAGTLAVSVVQKATTTIPIVMGAVADPVGSGLIKSLAQPGGNITGQSNMAGDLRPKQLEMLLAMVPKLSRVAVLVNPTNTGNTTALKRLQAEAQTRGVTILFREARTPQEIDNAFTLIRQQNVGALMVSANTLFVQQRNQIAGLAAKHRLPSIAADRTYTEAGGLMSYGSNTSEMYRRVATYVDRILKGTKPADLPVEQPTTFELVINGKTAKALGLIIPQALLISANKVIE